MNISLPWKAIRRLFLVFCLVAAAMPASATDFYTAVVPVGEGDEAAQRQKGLAAALHAVVAQVTGNTQAADSLVLQPEYLSAARYAKEYHFIDTETGRQLDARFEPTAVDAMLQRFGLAPWSDRPAVLAWLAGPGDGAPQLLSAETRAVAWEALESAAIHQGLSLLRPLMDLEDQTQLQASDISARVAGPVRDASIRYNADAVVSAYLTEGDESWQADWMLLSGELTRRWSTRGSNASSALGTGIADAAEILDTVFPRPGTPALDLSLPPPPGGLSATGDQLPAEATTADAPASVASVSVPEGQVVARIAGIVGPGDYNRAMKAIRDNTAVEKASVIAVEPDAVVVALTPAASDQNLAEALEAGGALQGEPSGAVPATTSGITLFFRLIPATP